ncbi:hypothetical protein CPLU01_16038, partial [Colletotrichum plurivorum]
MTDQDILFILLTNLETASFTLTVTPDIDKDDWFPNNNGGAAYSFFQLFSARREWNENRGFLSRASMLQEMSIETLTGLVNEFAKTSLLVENSQRKSLDAAATISENKLHMRQYTLWPMVAGFLLLSVLCLILQLAISRQTKTIDIAGSIASLAVVLTSSPSLMMVLKGTGHYRSSQLKAKLKTVQFSVEFSSLGSLSVEAISHTLDLPALDTFTRDTSAHNSSTQDLLALKEAPKTQPWLPLSARSPMIALLFTLPLLCIVVLEILQSMSDCESGIGIFRLESGEITTLFNSLDSTVAIFAAFNSLGSGGALADKSKMFHLLKMPSPLVPFNAMRLQHRGPTASYLACFLGGFLTIVVSGLWVTKDYPHTEWTPTSTFQPWVMNWSSDQLTDNGAGTALNIIRHEGAQTPPHIRDTNVLPQISLTHPWSSTKSFNATYNATVLRPVLQCTALSRQQIYVDSKATSGKVGWQDASEQVILDVPSACSPDIRNGVGKLKGIEEIPATVTYQGDPREGKLGDFQLHQERAKAWRNATSNSTGFTFTLENLLISGLTNFPVASENPGIDIFFNHLIFGSGGSAADYFGSENIERLKEAVVRNYAEYMTHIIDLNMRSDNHTSIQGTLHQTTTRLSIHRTSKIILQALLTSMIVLGMITIKLVKLRGMLPRNPCSIASTMGFLAGSRLCDPDSGIIPEGAGLMTEQELGRHFEGYVFSLGWWDENSDRDEGEGTSAHDRGAGDQEEEQEAAAEIERRS